MAEKLIYTMGEVAEMFDVSTSLLRHWESQFSVLRPMRNKKGNRLFSLQDVENLKLIYHMVKEKGMTLDGVKKALRKRSASPVDEVSRDAELMERLQQIRSLLEEVREDLKTGDGELLADTSGEGVAPLRRSRTKPVVRIPESSDGEVAATTEKPVRKPRRKKGEAENKELFAFFEQSLF